MILPVVLCGQTKTDGSSGIYAYRDLCLYAALRGPGLVVSGQRQNQWVGGRAHPSISFNRVKGGLYNLLDQTARHKRPLKDMRITAGYKHPQYLKEWGWPHYGVDCYDPNTHDVLALGDGEVIAAGQDGPTLTGNLSRLGMVTVIVYRDVLCSDGKVLRYCGCLYPAVIRISLNGSVSLWLISTARTCILSWIPTPSIRPLRPACR